MLFRTELKESNLVAGYKHHAPDGPRMTRVRSPRVGGIQELGFPPESKRMILSVRLCPPLCPLW